jgi:hypothetical protein
LELVEELGSRDWLDVDFFALLARRGDYLSGKLSTSFIISA